MITNQAARWFMFWLINGKWPITNRISQPGSIKQTLENILESEMVWNVFFFNVLIHHVEPPPPTHTLSQVDHVGGRGGGHLRHLRHVLHPGQLRPLPHPGARHQGQTPAVRQRRQPAGLLGGQLLLGHGRRPGRKAHHVRDNVQWASHYWLITYQGTWLIDAVVDNDIILKVPTGHLQATVSSPMLLEREGWGGGGVFSSYTLHL